MLLEFEDAKGSFAHDPLSSLLRVEGGVVKDSPQGVTVPLPLADRRVVAAPHQPIGAEGVMGKLHQWRYGIVEVEAAPRFQDLRAPGKLAEAGEFHVGVRLLGKLQRLFVSGVRRLRSRAVGGKSRAIAAACYVLKDERHIGKLGHQRVELVRGRVGDAPHTADHEPKLVGLAPDGERVVSRRALIGGPVGRPPRPGWRSLPACPERQA